MIIPSIEQMLHDFGDRKYVQRKIKRCPFLINTHDTDLPIMHNCRFDFFMKGGGVALKKKKFIIEGTLEVWNYELCLH